MLTSLTYTPPTHTHTAYAELSAHSRLAQPFFVHYFSFALLVKNPPLLREGIGCQQSRASKPQDLNVTILLLLKRTAVSSRGLLAQRRSGVPISFCLDCCLYCSPMKE